MPEASFSDRPHKPSGKDVSAEPALAAFSVFRSIISQITSPLLSAAGWMRVRRFRRDVLKQMSLTVKNLHPEVIMGGTDRRGWYAEIYLNFTDFRLRITRAIYNSRHQDLWAEIGSTSDPAAFFRIDYLMAALTRLDKQGELAELSRFPDTLAALDASIWAVHHKLAEHLSASRYGETKTVIQQVMHEEAALAHME